MSNETPEEVFRRQLPALRAFAAAMQGDEFTYEVVPGWSTILRNCPVWTVIESIDGVARGSDHHWLSERTAYLAKLLYEVDENWHGQPADDVQQELRRRGWTS